MRFPVWGQRCPKAPFDGHEHVYGQPHVARRDPGRRQGRPLARRQPPRSELVDTAERLEHAYDREARIVALDVTDREAILRVLEECPEELLELRATLLQERVWRLVPVVPRGAA